MRRVHVGGKSKISGFPIVEVTGHNRCNFNDYSISRLKFSQVNSSASVNKSSPRDNLAEFQLQSNQKRTNHKVGSFYLLDYSFAMLGFFEITKFIISSTHGSFGYPRAAQSFSALPPCSDTPMLTKELPLLSLDLMA